eukprot:16939-Heterococcus_DN1.PRE.1
MNESSFGQRSGHPEVGCLVVCDHCFGPDSRESWLARQRALCSIEICRGKGLGAAESSAAEEQSFSESGNSSGIVCEQSPAAGALMQLCSGNTSSRCGVLPGISRDSRHKRRETGGKRCQVRKKRKFELGRPAANTKMGPTRVREHSRQRDCTVCSYLRVSCKARFCSVLKAAASATAHSTTSFAAVLADSSLLDYIIMYDVQVRCRGGNLKFRALRLETGNYSWGSEVATRKTRILDVVHNATNNEMVRTKTLVKGAIVSIDATPFRQWYEAHYGVTIGHKKGKKVAAKTEDAPKKSESAQRRLAARQKTRTLDPALDDQFASGRILACISSRPGQVSRRVLICVLLLCSHYSHVIISTGSNGGSASNSISNLHVSVQHECVVNWRQLECMPLLKRSRCQVGRADGYILEGKELEFYQKLVSKKKGSKH